jgi:hypothetical protein
MTQYRRFNQDADEKVFGALPERRLPAGNSFRFIKGRQDTGATEGVQDEDHVSPFPVD